MIVKQQAKTEQAHPVCLHAVEKNEKVEISNAKIDSKQVKKWTDKKKTNLFSEFCKSV